MSESREPHEDDAVPEGVCTAPSCKCSCFRPRRNSKMYCSQDGCAHSVEWHHLNARSLGGK